MEDTTQPPASSAQGMAIDIFTVMGHDLKSPLNAVESYLEIMGNRVLGDSLDPYLPVVENSLARIRQMRELITDVVDWSRMQQSVPRNSSVLDVSKMARHSLEGFVEEAGKRNISVLGDIEEGLCMQAMPGEIELIFRHLLSNALRYNKDHGSVKLRVNKSDAQIVVTVTDTGIGLSMEEQARLFEAFVRIKNSQTRDIRGTGLGLAIVKKVAEIYSGAVGVESAPDVGTTFTVRMHSGCDAL